VKIVQTASLSLLPSMPRPGYERRDAYQNMLTEINARKCDVPESFYCAPNVLVVSERFQTATAGVLDMFARRTEPPK